MMKNHFKLLTASTLICLSFASFAQEDEQPKLPNLPLPDLPGAPSVNDQAFKQVQESTTPLTPEQIRQARKNFDEIERAAAELPRWVPIQKNRSQIIDLRPGTVSPVVRIFPGYITNIMFSDESGQPVNVIDVAQPHIGNSDLFTIRWSESKDQRSHMLRITPNKTYARGNISVTLQGVNSPISVTIVSGQRAVDDRVDMTVRGLNLPVSAISLPSDADPELIRVLSGIAPDGAEQLETSSQYVSAWKKGDYLYLQVSGIHMSPAPLSSRMSADGTQAVKLPLTTSVIVSIAGNRTMISIKGL